MIYALHIVDWKMYKWIRSTHLETRNNQMQLQEEVCKVQLR